MIMRRRMLIPPDLSPSSEQNTCKWLGTSTGTHGMIFESGGITAMPEFAKACTTFVSLDGLVLAQDIWNKGWWCHNVPQSHVTFVSVSLKLTTKMQDVGLLWHHILGSFGTPFAQLCMESSYNGNNMPEITLKEGCWWGNLWCYAFFFLCWRQFGNMAHSHSTANTEILTIKAAENQRSLLPASLANVAKVRNRVASSAWFTYVHLLMGGWYMLLSPKHPPLIFAKIQALGTPWHVCSGAAPKAGSPLFNLEGGGTMQSPA